MENNRYPAEREDAQEKLREEEQEREVEVEPPRRVDERGVEGPLALVGVLPLPWNQLPGAPKSNRCQMALGRLYLPTNARFAALFALPTDDACIHLKPTSLLRDPRQAHVVQNCRRFTQTGTAGGAL